MWAAFFNVGLPDFAHGQGLHLVGFQLGSSSGNGCGLVCLLLAL